MEGVGVSLASFSYQAWPPCSLPVASQSMHHYCVSAYSYMGGLMIWRNDMAE